MHMGRKSAAPSIMDHARSQGTKWNIPRHKDQRVTYGDTLVVEKWEAFKKVKALTERR